MKAARRRDWFDALQAFVARQDGTVGLAFVRLMTWCALMLAWCWYWATWVSR